MVSTLGLKEWTNLRGSYFDSELGHISPFLPSDIQLDLMTSNEYYSKSTAALLPNFKLLHDRFQICSAFKAKPGGNLTLKLPNVILKEWKDDIFVFWKEFIAAKRNFLNDTLK